MPRTPTRTPARAIDRRYVDPLDAVWLAAAGEIGLIVERSSEVFASSERGRVLIAGAEHLDADDCLAQMIFHELCHSLVEGPESFDARDWGLPLETGDPVREHACLRAQAHLAAEHGLRRVLAPTTDFRAFYDALGDDPLEPRADPSTQLAIAAIGRADRHPWSPALRRALETTATIARLAAPSGPADSLLAAVDSMPAAHPSGLPGGWIAGRRCGDCAWRDRDSGRCQQAGDVIDAGAAACSRFETEHDCLTCAACCRGAYDSVTVDADDPVVAAHPSLVVDRGEYLELARTGDNRCAALGDGNRCAIYAERPRCCREFEVGGEHCLTARRRVGLSI